jgi:hypothetical protein
MNRGLVTALWLTIGTAVAWGETLYYDGFGYEQPSAGVGADLWKYNVNAYQLGDPALPWQPPGHPTTYLPSPWVAANNGSLSGYWPFVIPFPLSIPGLPAGTGYSVEVYGSAGNTGKCARVPVGGENGLASGTVYYSLIVRVMESICLDPGVEALGGDFHVGFNHEAADPASTAVVRAATRLRLRRSVWVDGNHRWNIGVQADEDVASSATTVWDSTIYPGGTTSTPLFVVGSYEFRNNEGDTPTLTDDVCSLWVNPDRSTFGQATPPPATLTASGADIQNLRIRSFFIRHGNSAGSATYGYPVQRAGFDEVRIGTSWADVVPCMPPTLAGISPKWGLRGRTVTGVTITGSNFSVGATDVKLTRAGEPDIVGYNVNVADSGHLTCDFDLPDVPPQRRTLAVTTCGGTATVWTDAFLINCPPGDFDCDEDVDVSDMMSFVSCGSGPRIPYEAGCEYKDLDEDGDVDQHDFGIFQRCYGDPANPDCAN